MTEEKLNKKFEIPVRELEERIKSSLNGSLEGYNVIIPLRDIKTTENMTFIRNNVFENLIRNICLRTKEQNSDEKIYPYKDSEIRVFGREPKGCELGQTFVLTRKILSLMSILEAGIFQEFITKGLSKMPPTQVYGRDENERKVTGFYIPPIIEIHGNLAVLIDGIHRNYICNAAGTTTNAVHISNVSVPPPFTPIKWRDVRLTDEKPAIPERYKELKTEYFRDLGVVGIDG